MWKAFAGILYLAELYNNQSKGEPTNVVQHNTRSWHISIEKKVLVDSALITKRENLSFVVVARQVTLFIGS